MATEKSINELVLNKVESQSVYDYMLANDLVNDDELYFVDDNNKYYTKTEADTLLNAKANNNNVYSKTEADNKYLALSGGTLTGDIKVRNIVRTDNTGWTDFCGGTAYNQGAYLMVSGKDGARGGYFDLCANNGATYRNLIGTIDGSLKWDGCMVETITARGDEYIRYSSGLQFCWAYVTVNKTAASAEYNTFYWTFPAAFNGIPRVFANAYHDRFNAGAVYALDSATGATIYYVNDAHQSFTIQGVGVMAIGWWK